MSAWKDARAAAFAAMIVSYGDTVSYKGATVQCLSTPREWKLQQQRTDMMPIKPVIFSISQADYATFKSLGMQPRETMISNGDTFQVESIIYDQADASVDLRCYLKV